jgi:superfamily II DNA or RNA helicase
MEHDSHVPGAIHDEFGSGCELSPAPTLQVLQPAWMAGRYVRTRGRRWLVTGSSVHASCVSVRLSPASPGREPHARTLLVPFDRLRLDDSRPRWRRRPLRAAASAFAAHVVEDSVLGGARRLHPDLATPPWQLAVATAVATGQATRLLLADEVGLGKTVQAGFVLAALQARRAERRALVLAPAALRDQWARELARLFGWHATVMDATTLRQLRRRLPVGVNPWGLPHIAVTSIDFVKQPEVLASAATATWDLIIADEAHGLGAGTDRCAGAQVLAARAHVVLLLTATPHLGSDEAFDGLRRLGAASGEAPAVIVRRTRHDVGLPVTRRVRLLACGPSAADGRLWRALRSYAAAVWTASHAGAPSRLAMAVLLKRAASSPLALRRSLAHRHLSLGGEPQATQAALPFDVREGECDEADAVQHVALGEPGLADTGREIAWLRQLEDACHEALCRDGKLRALQRLLRRVREPVVVFTEYRDTLEYVAAALTDARRIAVLHGGLSRRDRSDAEASFLDGRADLLLATDVASEGLNLHRPARLVVSVELPWSPARLEQRIGRVDRIGQRRVVHAVTLVGRDGPERGVLRRLASRIARVRAAVGDTLGVRSLEDETLAAAALEMGEPPSPRDEERETCREVVTLADVPAADTVTLSAARALLDGRARPVGRRVPRRPTVPWATLRAGRETPEGVVLVFVVRVVSEAGTIAASVLVPVHVALDRRALAGARPAALVRAVMPRAAEAAAVAARARLDVALPSHLARVSAAAARVNAQLATGRETAALVAGTAGAVQPGLFDQRALADAARRRAAQSGRAATLEAELRRLRADARLRAPDPPSPIVAFVAR